MHARPPPNCGRSRPDWHHELAPATSPEPHSAQYRDPLARGPPRRDQRRPGGVPGLPGPPLHPDHRPHLRGEAALLPAPRRARAGRGGPVHDLRRAGAGRDLCRHPRRVSGGRPGLLPRISERPLELPTLHRAPAGPRVRHLQLRFPEPRRQRLRTRVPPAAMAQRPRGARPPRGAGLPAVAPRSRPGRVRALRRQPGGGGPPSSSRPTTRASGAWSPTAPSRRAEP